MILFFFKWTLALYSQFYLRNHTRGNLLGTTTIQRRRVYRQMITTIQRRRVYRQMITTIQRRRVYRQMITTIQRRRV